MDSVCLLDFNSIYDLFCFTLTTFDLIFSYIYFILFYLTLFSLQCFNLFYSALPCCVVLPGQSLLMKTRAAIPTGPLVIETFSTPCYMYGLRISFLHLPNLPDSSHFIFCSCCKWTCCYCFYWLALFMVRFLSCFQ